MSAGTSLAVQWLRLRASTAGGTGSTPGRGTKIPHARRPKKKKKKSFECYYEAGTVLSGLCILFHPHSYYYPYLTDEKTEA